MKAWVRSFVVVSALLLATQAWAVDLSGVWRNDSWGEINVTQQGQNVTATYTGNWGSLNLADYGFKAGDESFHGTLVNNQFTGKVLLHYPLSMKSICPAYVWASYFDMSLIVSSDGKTLTGQRGGASRDQSTCNITSTGTYPITFTKTSEAPAVTSNTCSPVTIDSNLNVHIPNAVYKAAFGNTMNLWVDLQYAPVNGVDNWKLRNFGVNP